MDHRMSELIKIESLSVAVDLIVEMGSNGSGIPEPTEEVQMAMYDAQMGKSQMANAPYEDAEEMDKAKPNYEDMIKPRSGGSTPSNPRLYEAVVREAKDMFDVYPSAVANAWVVGEYKRRGGTYKMDSSTEKTVWNGSLLDPKGFFK
jgi:hypothetical protein